MCSYISLLHIEGFDFSSHNWKCSISITSIKKNKYSDLTNLNKIEFVQKSSTIYIIHRVLFWVVRWELGLHLFIWKKNMKVLILLTPNTHHNISYNFMLDFPTIIDQNATIPTQELNKIQEN